MTGDTERVEIKEQEGVEEKQGKLGFQALEDKLMHLVLENDAESIEKGKIISEALDAGFGTLTVDLFFEKLVSNYSWAKQLFGERLIRLVSGYEAGTVETNRRIPEFQRELRSAIAKRLAELQKSGLISKEGGVQEAGVELASLLLFMEELDHLRAHAAGERTDSHAPDAEARSSVKPFRGERYKDIAVKKTVRLALRRGHTGIERGDLRAFERHKRGERHIIYALDASGSMKGDKLRNARKAGIALAHRALEERSKVGLLIFSKAAKHKVPIGASFVQILKALADVSAKEETDIAGAIGEALMMFPKGNVPRHLVLLTDSLPTIGTNAETLQEASKARNAGIQISIIGLNLDEEGQRLSERIVEIGNGRLYVIKNLEEVDTIVLTEYEHIRDD